MIENKRQSAKLKLIKLAELAAMMPYRGPGLERYSPLNGVPGQMLAAQSEEVRELLTHLKSEDLKDVRWESWR